MKRIITLLGSISFLLITMLALPCSMATASAASPVNFFVADAKSDACAGIGLTGGSCSGTGAQTQANSIIGTLTNIFLIVVAVVAVIMIIYAGMKFVTSSGDPSKIAAAKTTLIYAIVGLLIAAAAKTLVYFVLGNS